MTTKDVLKRALATFVAGAAAAAPVGAILGISAMIALAVAGLIAVFNLAGRLAQKWLTEHPEDAIKSFGSSWNFADIETTPTVALIAPAEIPEHTVPGFEPT